MKTRLALLTTAVAALLATAALSISRSSAQDPGAATAGGKRPDTPALPYEANCVLTVQPGFWPGGSGATLPSSAAGLGTDFTIRGKLAAVTPEWIVLRDGSFENWIPRDKVLTFRASR